MSPARRRRKTAARGYGSAHQRERARYAASVDAGQEICRRCAQPIPPGGNGPCPAPAYRHPGRCGKNHRDWDLGHHDMDRSIWTGPEHVCCNRGAPGRRRRQTGLTDHVRDELRRSREW